MRSDVEFPGFGGTCLRGWLYVPDGKKPGPGVVMAHGFSAVKEMFLDRFAEVRVDPDLGTIVWPNGADIVYDIVGGDSSEPALRAIAWEGRFLVIGGRSPNPRKLNDVSARIIAGQR